MRLPIEIKKLAVQKRKAGYSLSEIASELHISKSTSSLWLHSIPLSEKGIRRLTKKKILGQYKTILIRQERRKRQTALIENNAMVTIKTIRLSKRLSKLLCALIYYCEGVKGADNHVTFINSDPGLVRLFLSLFRKAFSLDEKKFRILMHLHAYHSERTQKLFWNKITNIPFNQFLRTYRKSNTKKRIRENYQGCVSIRYYDVIIIRALLAYYRMATKRFA